MSKNYSSTRHSRKTISKDNEAPTGLTSWPPVLGICGYSGSGKTTLIENLVPRLTARGLAVAVIKHDAHHLQFDQFGKDTDRIYRSGADVLAHDPHQTVLRFHGAATFEDAVRLLPCRYDLVLVEGHKASPVPKLWLSNDGRRKPPAGTSNVLQLITRTDDALSISESQLDTFLAAYHRSLPTCAGILPGDAGTAPTQRRRLNNILRRFAFEVFHLNHGRRSNNAWRAPAQCSHKLSAVVLEGVLCLVRGNPFVRWIFVREDVSADVTVHLHKFVGQCGPGRWAVVPRLPGLQKAVPLPPVFVCLPPAIAILERAVTSGRPLTHEPGVFITQAPA